MNIAITGSEGFIGSNLKKHFKDHTLNLHDIYNRDIQFDFNNADIVIHLGATNSIPRCEANPHKVLENNIEFFIETFKFYTKAKLFIYASSSSVYARSNHFSDYVDIVPPKTLYGISKHTNEYLAEIMSRTFGVKTVGLRFFNIFGPYQPYNGSYAAFVPKCLNAILYGETIQLYNEGLNKRDFTPVSHLCYLIDKLISNHESIKTPHTVLNLGATESVKTADMYNALVKECERRGIKNKAKIELCPKREWEITETRADMKSWIDLGLVSEYELDEVYFYDEIKRTVGWYLDPI